MHFAQNLKKKVVLKITEIKYFILLIDGGNKYGVREGTCRKITSCARDRFFCMPLRARGLKINTVAYSLNFAL